MEKRAIHLSRFRRKWRFAVKREFHCFRNWWYEYLDLLYVALEVNLHFIFYWINISDINLQRTGSSLALHRFNINRERWSEYRINSWNRGHTWDILRCHALFNINIWYNFDTAYLDRVNIGVQISESFSC